MLCELDSKNKVVGLKQLRKVLAEGRAAKVFTAQDADPKLTGPIKDACRASGRADGRGPHHGGTW